MATRPARVLLVEHDQDLGALVEREHPDAVLVAPELLCSLIEQVRALKQELTRVQKGQAERRLVDAAKCRVMERLGLTEAAAYRYLQAEAMNRRRSLAETARHILGAEDAVD